MRSDGSYLVIRNRIRGWELWLTDEQDHRHSHHPDLCPPTDAHQQMHNQNRDNHNRSSASTRNQENHQLSQREEAINDTIHA